MKLPGLLRPGARYPLAPTLLRVYLLVGVAVLGVGFLLYFQSLTKRVDRQTESMSEVVARFVVIAVTTTTSVGADSSSAELFNDVLRRLDFPVVLSDRELNPMFWNASQVGVPELTEEEFFDKTPSGAEKLERVRVLQAKLDRRHDPIALSAPGTQSVFAHVHYGSPPISRELRWIPWVAILAAAVFGFTALISLRSIKRAEQGFIWAGMAKESAHQMGTPISSLLGWVEVLQAEVNRTGDIVQLPVELFDEVVGEVARDADRLNRVAARFSQIGSAPKLTSQPVTEIIQQTVDYFSHRLPRQRSKMTLEYEGEDSLPLVPLNSELLSWVLENLIKNAMDAADKAEGRVRITAKKTGDGTGVRIAVRDNGRGVAPGMERQIFRPGVSTRTRGWGLGLALASRIVTEYHGGHLELSWSEPGKGAEFTMTLPAAP